MISYGRQNITAADIEAVVSVLQSDFLTQGPMVPQFENAIADWCSVDHCVAVNSATSALHIACLALGLGVGDMLWTSPNTFVASANCGLYCGANIDFVDIDPQTYNVCAVALEEKLIKAEKAGSLPKVVIPVHFAGRPAPMREIRDLSNRYGFKILEDASHAIGAEYENSKVGSCEYSDITVFSFHPVKIITTAEGGAATTNDPDIASRMELLRSHGITRNKALMTNRGLPDWHYEQIDLGFNYRMTDIQAALGISQLSMLEQNIAARARLSQRYDRLLREFDLDAPTPVETGTSSIHLYPIKLRTSEQRLILFMHLRARNIGVTVHYIPVHTQPVYRELGFSPGDFPEAEKYYSRALSLPIYPTLTDEQQDEVVKQIRIGLHS